jgi:hypothetical protein
VLAFRTRTSRLRQPTGRADVLRSTPSMLKPWSASNEESSPATPSMMSARRAVSSLLSAIGRMTISADMVASAGSWSSRKVPRMEWEPTTITAGVPMIWQAVRIWEQAAHGRHLAHLDGVAVEAREDAVQAEYVTVIHQQVPAVQVAAVRLAGNAAAKMLKVALDGRAPFLEAGRGQADGEPAVEPPGPPLGAVEVRHDGPPGHF